MSEPFIAEIRLFAGNFAPRGWSLCDGQLLPISSYSAVFSLLGTTFGGDGRTTFGLPDLRGRTAVHPGNGPGLQTVTWGQRAGSNTNTLIVNNLPSHNHALMNTAIDEDGNLSEAGGNVLAEGANRYHAGPGNSTIGGTTANVGNNQPVNNMQPYLGIYHIISLIGVYPSRN